ncbi:36198_t:CDS:10 [Gigaspora margarita]|uniref:36198_t:CDS:1 n=1 Tax=Gigaspora margarita TaxID=4874 RepID=A0ABM8W6I5_GIGMA|nr:36198_t:CDS:10 [Gigaspora margarita]
MYTMFGSDNGPDDGTSNDTNDANNTNNTNINIKEGQGYDLDESSHAPLNNNNMEESFDEDPHNYWIPTGIMAELTMNIYKENSLLQHERQVLLQAYPRNKNIKFNPLSMDKQIISHISKQAHSINKVLSKLAYKFSSPLCPLDLAIKHIYKTKPSNKDQDSLVSWKYLEETLLSTRLLILDVLSALNVVHSAIESAKAQAIMAKRSTADIAALPSTTLGYNNNQEGILPNLEMYTTITNLYFFPITMKHRNIAGGHTFDRQEGHKEIPIHKPSSIFQNRRVRFGKIVAACKRLYDIYRYQRSLPPRTLTPRGSKIFHIRMQQKTMLLYMSALWTFNQFTNIYKDSSTGYGNGKTDEYKISGILRRYSYNSRILQAGKVKQRERFTIDSNEMILQIPNCKVKELIHECAVMYKKTSIHIRKLASLIEKLIAITNQATIAAVDKATYTLQKKESGSRVAKHDYTDRCVTMGLGRKKESYKSSQNQDDSEGADALKATTRSDNHYKIRFDDYSGIHQSSGRHNITNNKSNNRTNMASVYGDIRILICSRPARTPGQEDFSIGDLTQSDNDFFTMAFSALVSNIDGSPDRYLNNTTSQCNLSQGNHTPQKSQMEDLRRFSDRVAELYISSYDPKASETVSACMQKWFNWCASREYDPIRCPLQTVVDFLDDLYNQNMQYNMIASYRSAISEAYVPVERKAIGAHPIVVRVTKGLYNLQLPKQKPTNIVDVLLTMDYIQSLGPNSEMTILNPTQKMALLLALHQQSCLTKSSKDLTAKDTQMISAFLAQNSGADLATIMTLGNWSNEALSTPQ